ncbi:nucleoporin complex subunit 54 family protein [Mycobacterium sp. PSTR-4-N]|nr:nucleoporin complex subunit 54 family protein [Mycobacterium sp. PSTR-4-N]MCG7593280.1 nucleoporin complex subunit 54 family protein [Mycobacterium sp. PSTR-4-N]
MTMACSAACSSPAQQEPPPSTTASPSVGHGSLAYCLSQHGMPKAPGPVTGPPAGVDPAKWEAAMRDCSSLAPGPGAPAQP